MTKFRNKRFLTLILALVMLAGSISPGLWAQDMKEITVIGTTDVHGNIYNWNYEDNKEYSDKYDNKIGLTTVASIVKEARSENPGGVVLIDNGDTIQGTLLTDEVFLNKHPNDKNPMIDTMNFMKYDAMTLGNHEFNFGMEMVEKIKTEAEFPILAANMTRKSDGSVYSKAYEIVEKNGVKIAILGLTHPQIERWEGTEVSDFNFEATSKTIEKYMEELKELKKDGEVDVIIVSTHTGHEEKDEFGKDIRQIIAENTDIDAVMMGHSHAAFNSQDDENDYIDKDGREVLVGSARSNARQIVRFDLKLAKNEDGRWEVAREKSKVKDLDTGMYDEDVATKTNAKKYHDKAIDYISEVIGKSKADFQPANEVEGIAQAYLEDTPVIDLINNVQLKAFEKDGVDISTAALFQYSSDIKKGDITYGDIFNIYKFPNTLKLVEMSGKELKDYMEFSARMFNTPKKGDATISFNEEFRAYRYDMFAGEGLEYKIDISKPMREAKKPGGGERIVDLKINGKPVDDNKTYRVAVNDFRYADLVEYNIIDKDNEPIKETDPTSIRALIADYIRDKKEIDPAEEFDKTWELIGYDLSHPRRDEVIKMINDGKLELSDYNNVAINIDELIAEGKLDGKEENSVDPKDFVFDNVDKLNISDRPIKVFNNEDEMKFDKDMGIAIIDENQRTLVPLRAISENLGHEVEWDAEEWKITIDNKNVLYIGNELINSGEENIEMDTTPFIAEGRTYVPLRFVAEVLGYEVDFNSTKDNHNILIKVD